MDVLFGELSKWGIPGVVIGLLFIILWRMLIWVMAFVKDIMIQQNVERQSWLLAQSKHNELLSKISGSIDEHDRRADERGRYVREEHQEMIKVLGRINGYKKEQ